MRYLKTFENHNNYEDFTETEAFIKPNVSYCILLNEVHYNPETRLIVKYNVTDASEPTQLYYYFLGESASTSITATLMFDRIEIDSVTVSISDLDTAEGKYQLSVGEHTVKYTLKDPTSIDNSAFKLCSSLTTAIIPNSVTSINNSAFGYCSSLTSITIPDSVTSIGNHIFQRCSNLTNITIPNSITKIGSYAFHWCTSLTSMTIPNSVTSIGYAAFDHCTSLTSVAISSSATSIGEMAFSNCNVLASIDIPNSVTSIGNNAFSGCTNLTSTTIGNSVISIGKSAFSGCSGLTSVVSLATTAPTIESSTFSGVKTNGTLTVPSGSTGYDVWMGTGNYYLGKYSWTKVEQ